MVATLLFYSVLLIPLWLLSVAGKALWHRLFGMPLMTGKDIRHADSLFSRVAHATLGVAMPMGNPRENMATVFAFGRKEPRQEEHLTVFLTPAGWRYGFPVVGGFLVYFALHFQSQSGYAMTWSEGLFYGALLLYMGAYIWNFRLTIDGVDLTVTNYFFQTRTYDLTQMVGVRRQKEGYKIYFADGRKASLPLFFEGRDVLLSFLSEELEANGY